MNMKYKKNQTNRIYFFSNTYTRAKNEQKYFFSRFHHRQLFAVCEKLGGNFFSHTVIQLWVVGVCPTTIALASKKYSSRLSNSNTIFQFNKLTKKRYEYTRTEKRVTEPRERRKKGEIKSLKLQVRWKERKIIHTLYALTAHCTTTVAVWQYTV